MAQNTVLGVNLQQQLCVLLQRDCFGESGNFLFTLGAFVWSLSLSGFRPASVPLCSCVRTNDQHLMPTPRPGAGLGPRRTSIDSHHSNSTHVELLGSTGAQPLANWQVAGPLKGVQKVCALKLAAGVPQRDCLLACPSAPPDWRSPT